METPDAVNHMKSAPAPAGHSSISRLAVGLRWAAPPLIALALALLLNASGPTFADGDDWLRMQLFFKEYYREAFLGGRLPLWSPEVALGRPFLADIETATLYPANLLFLAGPAAGALVAIALHLLLAIQGGLRLGRTLGLGENAAWLGALGFALGAPLLGRLQAGQFQVFCALCWMPALFWRAHRLWTKPDARRAAGLAIVLALTFLAGSPPMFWVMSWAAIAWLLLLAFTHRRPFAMLRAAAGTGALAAALAIALVAVQALPFIELVGQGNRSGADPGFALRHGMEAAGWTALWRSRPDGRFFYWEYNLYCGALLAPLALIAFARIKHHLVSTLLILLLFFALLATGGNGPLLPWMAKHVPDWDLFRLPSRYAIVTAFALVWLAAFGLDAASRLAGRLGPRLGRGIIPLLVIANAVTALQAHRERALAYSAKRHDWQEKELVGELRETGALRSGHPPPRILAPFWIIRENSGLREGYGMVGGFANPALGRVWRHLHEAIGQPPDSNNPITLPSRIYTIDPERLADLAIDARWNPVALRFDHAAAPGKRAWILPETQVQLSANEAGALQTIEPSPSSGAWHSASILDFTPESVTVAVEASAPSVLVLSEPWYPGWEASLNGHPVPVAPVNGWMRGALLPATGSGVVVFRYKSSRLPLGAVLTVAGLIGLVLCLRPGRPPASLSTA